MTEIEIKDHAIKGRDRDLKQLDTELREARAEIERLRKALESAVRQMDIARRFLPSHGTFGEEGISAYEDARASTRAALSSSSHAEKEVTTGLTTTPVGD